MQKRSLEGMSATVSAEEELEEYDSGQYVQERCLEDMTVTVCGRRRA